LQAVSEISEKLAKLRNIPDLEKTHTALLNSRIDEQSQLIMVLKKRADEHLVRLMAVERINKDLEEFRDSAKSDLEKEYRRYNMLDKRFNELAENHEQMIAIKVSSEAPVHGNRGSILRSLPGRIQAAERAITARERATGRREQASVQ